jgi:hypothetical protein
MASPTSLRLRPDLRAEIERIAKRTRRSFSGVVQSVLEEGLRMRACPGVYFADEPAGREAKLAGTGLGVWEVVRDDRAAGGDEARLRTILPHLTPWHVHVARSYAARYPAEVDELIADNDRLSAGPMAGA